MKNTLSATEKAAKKQERIKRLELQIKQLKAVDKAKEKKRRTWELIQIGLAFCQYHDRKDLLAYLQNSPKFVQFGQDGEKLSIKEERPATGKYTLYISPKIAPLKTENQNNDPLTKREIK